MKKINIWFKKNKVWKWLIIDLFVLFFGASIIINITYLPKYWNLVNRTDSTLKIEIQVINQTNNNQVLFDTNYETTMMTLGDLLNNYQEIYNLRGAGGLGHELYSITYYDLIKKTDVTLVGGTEPGLNYRWIIYCNNSECNVGIDGWYLENRQFFQIYYENNQ